MKTIITCVILAFALPLYCKPIVIDDAVDYHILDQFFKIMFREELFGYVLEGNKPISVINIYPLDSLLSPHSRSFKMKVLCREAMDVWNRIAPAQKDFVLKVTKVMDHDSYFYEFVFINRLKLKEVIDENINLFRFHVSPTLETSSLVNLITDSEHPLREVCKGSHVLTGILLGYGVFNSLMGGRLEEIEDARNHCDYPPFVRDNLSKCAREKVDWDLQNLFFGHAEPIADSPEIPALKSAVGCKSLYDEVSKISSMQEEVPKVLLEEAPRFVMGAYVCSSNKTLFEGAIRSQKNIQRLLTRSDFLEYVLERIAGEKPTINCPVASSSKKHLFVDGSAEEAIAEFVWENAQSMDRESISQFIDAFCKRNPMDKKKPRLRLLWKVVDGFKKAKINLDNADAKMLALSRTRNVEEVIPQRLYFECLQVGQGKVANSSELLLSYVIENGFGEVLTAQHMCWVDLTRTIPGFSHGMKGMREGEVRKVYIHPEYGYGALTSITPCTYLVVKVTLHKANEQKNASLLPLSPIDLSWVRDPNFSLEIEEATHQNARYFGNLWGEWLSQSSHLKYSLLCENLNRLARSEVVRPLSIEHYMRANRVFWNLIAESQSTEFLPSSRP